MKLRCNFTPLVENVRNGTFNPLSESESFTNITHFRFDLFSLKQEIKRGLCDHDPITFEWVEDELIRSSVVHKYDKEKTNKFVYFHFSGYSWFYSYNSQDIYMTNSDINF